MNENDLCKILVFFGNHLIILKYQMQLKILMMQKCLLCVVLYAHDKAQIHTGLAPPGCCELSISRSDGRH
jgi:hypothetical protein